MREESITSDDFPKEIHKFTLRFTDAVLETKYNRERASAIRIFWPFKLLFTILLLLLLYRRIANLFLADSGLRSINLPKYITIINLVSIGITFLLELIIYFIKRLTIFKGVIYITYTFCIVSYTSYHHMKDNFSDIPMGIPSYLSALIIGTVYVRCWLTASCGCFISLIVKLYYTWIQEASIYEISLFSLLYAVCYSLIASYFYINEYGIRCRFYLLHKREEVQNNYYELLKNLPVGLILLDLNNAPFFYNNAIEDIVAKEDSKVTMESDENHAAEKVNKLFSSLKEKDKQIDLKTNLEKWNSIDIINPKVYTYLEDNVYLVKGLGGTFRQQNCKILILEDQTSLYNLNKIEKKYQKLYLDSVVHDIRTPLNGIFGMLEMINAFDLDNEVKNYIDAARKMCKLMLFLTYDIIDYAHMEANKFKLNYSKVNIRAIIEELNQLFESKLKTRAVQYQLTIDDNVRDIICIDKTRYMQIFLNIMSNAIKYTFEGFIKVRVTYDEERGYLVTYIQDTGIGIKEEDIPKLFKLFGKLDWNIEYNVTGIGFGLTISKKLVESMQGDITVETKEKVGTTFTFTIKENEAQADLARVKHDNSICTENAGASILEEIPVQKLRFRYLDYKPKSSLDSLPKEIYNHNPITLTKKRPQSKLTNHDIRNTITQSSTRRGDPNLLSERSECDCAKILIVDDNEYNIYVLQSYLKPLKVVVDEALNGQEAIDKIKNKTESHCCKAYKLVLMDINMPIMDGITATKIIKEKVLTKEIPRTIVIALSAKTLDEENHSTFCHRVGFVDYLNKPISKNEFIELVKAYGITYSTRD